MMEAGILCVPMAGMSRKQQWSATLSVMILLLMVRDRCTGMTGMSGIICVSFIFQCQLYPALVEVQAPFSHRAFSVQVRTPNFMSVPEQIKTKVSVSMWQESSVKVCGKVFSTFVYWQCDNLVLSPTAPCLSSHFTDCNNCGSTGCIVSDHSCNCRSDCYEAGDCCPDVSHVQNCLGESSFPVCAVITYHTQLDYDSYQQIKDVKRGKYVWWVE